MIISVITAAFRGTLRLLPRALRAATPRLWRVKALEMNTLLEVRIKGRGTPLFPPGAYFLCSMSILFLERRKRYLSLFHN